jgi:hypothetical protein
MNQPIRALLIKRALLPSWSRSPGSGVLLVSWSRSPGSGVLLVLLVLQVLGSSWSSWSSRFWGPGLLAKVTKVTKVTCESYIKKLHIKVTFNACVIMQGMI